MIWLHRVLGIELHNLHPSLYGSNRRGALASVGLAARKIEFVPTTK